MSQRHEVGAFRRDPEFEDLLFAPRQNGKTFFELRKPGTGFGGNVKSLGEQSLEPCQKQSIFFRVNEIGFVENDLDLLFIGTDLFEDIESGFPFTFQLRRRDIQQQKQKICQYSFLKRGFERLNQRMGQFADKTHGVNEYKFSMISQLHLAGSGIESRKELVFDKNIRSRQGLKQRGFAHIGVSDDSSLGDGAALTGFAAGGALFADGLQFFGELLNFALQQSAVGFDLGFALTTVGGSASPLTGKMTPRPGQPGQ